MSTALEELNRELEDRHGVRIEARTGVNTGEDLAEDTRADAPLTTDDTNTAARLEQTAGPGEILIGESTYRLVRDAVTVEPAGPLELKGKASFLTATWETRARVSRARCKALLTEATEDSRRVATPIARHPRTSRRMRTARWRGGRSWITVRNASSILSRKM
jgi:class 3 adenylate cyclase